MTRDDVLDALRNAMAKLPASQGPQAVTVAEYGEANDLSPTLARTAIKALLKAGLVEHVKVYRPAMDGTMRPSPGYRLVA